MRLFFVTLVLIFILFCNQIETSSDNLMESRLLGRGKTKKDENRVKSLDTSRLTTLPAPRHRPTSIEHDALDLHRYPPYILESSQQTRSKEVLDLAKKFKMRHEHDFQGSSSTRMIQNDQVQHPQKKSTQKDAPQENIDWLIHHFRYGTPPVFDGQRRRKKSPKSREETELDAKLAEARKVYALTFKEHSKLIQKGLRQDSQQLDDRIEYKEEDAIKQFLIHYPHGLPDPPPQPQFVHRNHPEGSGSGSKH